MEIILFEPEIPPNTGNIARLSAGLGLRLNLIEPLGFSLADKYLKRAGLDYWPYVDLKIWAGWDDFQAAWARGGGGRLIGSSARRGRRYIDFAYQPNDGLVFGPETRGLPETIAGRLSGLVTVPLNPQVRSLNLATAVGLIAGEALRQTGGFKAAGRQV